MRGIWFDSREKFVHQSWMRLFSFVAVLWIGSALLWVPVTHQMARVRVATALASTEAALDRNWISQDVSARFLSWLHGSQDSDAFCSAAKQASKTAEQDGGQALGTSVIFLAIVQHADWMPPSFAVSEISVPVPGLNLHFLNTPPTPPPQNLIG